MRFREGGEKRGGEKLEGRKVSVFKTFARARGTWRGIGLKIMHLPACAILS